jgi:indole-3-glycerol phosphate synthase
MLMSFLYDILEVKKDEIKKLKAKRTLSSFSNEEFFASPVMSLKMALCKNDRFGIISEIKKASPSKGILNHNFNHLKLAETYFKCDTDAISVLTDRNFFQGDINFISDIAKIKTSPILRKDFIINEYQIMEAKAYGADAILLIAEALTASQISELSHAAFECGLEVLLELHSESELSKINFKLNNLIGINNRNLETFNVDINTTGILSEKIPHDVIKTSESGLSTKSDINKLKKTNVNAILIGEYFMKSTDIKMDFMKLKEWCTNAG